VSTGTATGGTVVLGTVVLGTVVEGTVVVVVVEVVVLVVVVTIVLETVRRAVGSPIDFGGLGAGRQAAATTASDRASPVTAAIRVKPRPLVPFALTCSARRRISHRPVPPTRGSGPVDAPLIGGGRPDLDRQLRIRRWVVPPTGSGCEQIGARPYHHDRDDQDRADAGDDDVLSSTVRGAVRRHGERAVVIRGDDALTYSALDRAADRAAGALAAAGVGPGDVVASVLPSGAEWLIAAVAIDRLGAIHAAVSNHLGPSERAALVASVRPSVALCDPATADGLPLRTDVVGIAPGGRLEELGSGSYGREADDDAQRVAAICFTSGTTGVARGATFRVRHLAAVSAIDLGPGAQAWGGGEAMLASTHFAHVGMALKLPWYVRTGSTLCVLDRWRADDALGLIDEHRMSTVGGIAPQIALMLRSPRIDEVDLSCVRRLIVGGAPSSPDLVDRARRRFGADYSIRYSSTESGGVGLATAYDADDDEALHTVGRPRPGIEARIADPDDVEVPDGTTGELQLRSAAVTDGYWNDPEATVAAITGDGWLRTGDLAHRTPTGCISLDGRRTDMYIRGGYNVFPTEVEAVLELHPDVAAVAVVPRPDEVLGDVGVAVVVPLSRTRVPELEDLRRFAGEHLARHKLPEDIVVLDELPLTPASKLDRSALRDRVRTPREGAG
jgi:acyl-CoA synthetase (AMP-forming)/AMP-acid ligase II